MQIEYRLARMEDMGEICRLVANAVDKMIENDILQWDEIYPTEVDFREDINKKELYVGIVDGRIAVVYALNQECDDAYKGGKWKHEDIPYYVIHRLCVNPDFQNMGIGRQTLLHIEEQLLLIGIKAIRLDVFTQNPYALRLYDGLDYELVGYADWRKGRFCLMEKYLG
ncbi:MAG: GNAT family N-acetyltransferase [Lachnospiraceae bacterium]|nr:GNAT family N-acetyltransferase [Lachnospiraceae bacterium]